jgi:hypothetical protein
VVLHEQDTGEGGCPYGQGQGSRHEKLVEQIGMLGLIMPYKCHKCRASISIALDSSVSYLEFCSFFGSPTPL